MWSAARQLPQSPVPCSRTSSLIFANSVQRTPVFTVLLRRASGAGYYAMSGRPYDPIVQLDGTSAAGASGGLILRTDDSTIRGFIVHSFPDEGLEVELRDSLGKAQRVAGVDDRVGNYTVGGALGRWNQ